MSLRLVRAVAKAERSDDLHIGRLMVLLDAASGKRGTKTIEGIMKLAKLDFLLRYPNCLERTLAVTTHNPEDAAVQPHERNTIETKMVRFRYGPWDSRYRRWIGLMVAKGLGRTFVQGNTVHVGLTEKGRDVARALKETDDFSLLASRSELIVKAVGSLSGTRLKEFVYEQFPEVVSMRWGEEITYETLA
jgi:hypothetical protein